MKDLLEASSGFFTTSRMAKASFMQNKKGFTLIELLVVVAIIGLLATLGVIAFRDAQKKGRDTKRLGDAKAIINAFATAGQEGKALCTASCAALAAASLPYKANTLLICNTCSGVATDDVTTQYVNLKGLLDPLNGGSAACTSAASVCQYSVDKGTQALPDLSDFKVYFYTELAAAGLPGGGTAATIGQHIANQNGMVQ